MTTSSAVHSNAFNFMGFLQHCVDPRTGQYTVTVDLPELKSNQLCGPAVPLQLQFNPLNLEDSGFGVGWNLSLSQYTPVGSMLALSTGENFMVTGSGAQPAIKEKKLDSFHFYNLGADTYRVVHKSGLVETLVTGGSGDKRVALPREIRAPSGHSVSLTYKPFMGGQLLETVRDAFTTLLRIERDPNNQFVKLHLHPDSGPGGTPLASFEMRLNGRQEVTSIILPTAENASWRFNYEQIRGHTCLVKVQTPVGGEELIEYKDGGHPYPNPSTPIEHLPRVTRHTTVPGFGQPDIVVDYSYTTHNFLGNGASINWLNDGLDNLYRVQTSYEYGSVAKLKDGDTTVRSVTRTYNRFHLQIEEVIDQQGCIKRVSTEYHAEDGSFDQQPPQFQLPKAVTTRWSQDNETRTEVESTAFDEYGNLTEQVQASGIRETFDYYPKEGDDGCPADPEGFERNLRTKTVYPAPSAKGNGTVLQTVNRYEALPALDSAPDAPNWLVVTWEALTHSDDNHLTPLQHLQRSYNNEPHDATQHGRPKSQSETFNGKTTTTEFAYSTPLSRLAGESVDQTVETLTGFDGTKKVVTFEQSLFTGKPLVVPDINGVVVKSTYDALNRVTRETVAPDDPDFTASREYSYTLTSRTGQQAMQTVTDVKGIKTRTLLDGLNRPIEEGCWMPGQPVGEFRKTWSAQYDSKGNLAAETQYDWLDRAEEEPQALALTNTYGYDDWGMRCRVVGPDQVATVTERTPFGNRGPRETVWQETADDPPIKSGLSITEFNTFNKPDSVTRKDDKGVTVGSLLYAYDGKGNCIEQKHQLSGNVAHITGYAFDAFDRMTSTTLPDGCQINRSFAEHSSSELPVSIEVKTADEAKPAITVGMQQFDGLERLTELRVGPRVEQYKYTGDHVQPSQRISPSKQVFDYSYTLALTTQPRSIQINGNTAEKVAFGYDSQTALITGAGKNLDTPENVYTYDLFGHLQSESRSGSTGKARQTDYLNSRHGRQLSSKVVDGFETLYDYDDCGRVATVAQGGLKAEFVYNDFGQLHKSTTTHVSSNKTLVTDFEYDSLSRETKRTQTLSGQPVRVLNQIWFDDDHLQSREQLIDGLSAYKEAFVYDSRGRLQRYSCTGDHPPLDAYGNGISSQTFSFDALDNIEECLSIFADRTRDTASFTYAPNDSCQLLEVTHDHASYPAKTEFRYDDDGHMLNDEQGRQLSYNNQGRLLEVKDADSQPIISYRYDSHNDLIAVNSPSGVETLRFYQGYSLSHTVQGNTLIQCLYDQDNPIGQQQKGDDSQTLLFLTDASNSVLGEYQPDGQLRTQTYSAYGEQADDDLLSLLAFNGEMREEVGGWYLLGRGYRAYNPSLMRFHSPDSLSPFGEGGINPYMYCMGNPISFRDPTGHARAGEGLGRPGGDPGYEDPFEQPEQPDGGWLKWIGVIVAGVALIASVGFALFTGGSSLVIGIGVATQLAGIGFQVAGVLTQNETLNAVGYLLGLVGGTITAAAPAISKGMTKLAAYAAGPGSGAAAASPFSRPAGAGTPAGAGAGGSRAGSGATPRGVGDGASVRRVSNQSNQTTANTPSSSGGSPGIGNNANRGRWTRLNSFLSKVGFGGRWTPRLPKANLEPAVVNQLDRSDIPKPPTPASI